MKTSVFILFLAKLFFVNGTNSWLYVSELILFLSMFYFFDQKNKKIFSLQQQNNILVKENEEIKNALGFSKEQKFEFKEIVKSFSVQYFFEEEKNFTFSKEKFFKDMGVFCPFDEINYGYGK